VFAVWNAFANAFYEHDLDAPLTKLSRLVRPLREEAKEDPGSISVTALTILDPAHP